MIGPIIEATLPLLRQNAESLMLDRCKIERQDGPLAWSESLKKSVATWRTIANSPCNVDDPAGGDRELITDEVATPSRPSVYLPVTVTGIEPDDRVTITGIAPSTSVDLLNAVLWVTQVEADSQAVECHVECRRSR